MSEKIVPQDTVEVKECDVDFCHEDVFRRGLCWPHFKEEVEAEWDAWDATRQTCLGGVGYGPALDRDWWGYPVEEVGGDHHLPG